MPFAPPHPCSFAGCRERVPRGVKRCPTHAQQYEQQRRAQTPGRLVMGRRGHLIDYYQTPEWVALRDQVRAEEPICRECWKQGRAEPTYAVDHIIPRTDGGSDERSNLQGLCAAHHSEKTQREMRRSA